MTLSVVAFIAGCISVGVVFLWLTSCDRQNQQDEFRRRGEHID
jgi:hypothetical protein